MTDQEIINEHIKECVSIKRDNPNFPLVVIHKLDWFKPVGCSSPNEVQYIIDSWKTHILNAKKQIYILNGKGYLVSAQIN